jgi:hypothetical protein
VFIRHPGELDTDVEVLGDLLVGEACERGPSGCLGWYEQLAGQVRGVLRSSCWPRRGSGTRRR